MSENEPNLGKIIGICIGAAIGLVVVIVVLSKITGGSKKNNEHAATAVVTTAEATSDSTSEADLTQTSEQGAEAADGSSSPEAGSDAGEASSDTAGSGIPGSGLPGSSLPGTSETASSEGGAPESSGLPGTERLDRGDSADESSGSGDASETPVASDFSWFDSIAGGSVKADDYFKDAAVVSGSSRCEGDWKAYIRGIPGEKSSKGRHFLNVKLESSGRTASVSLIWGTYEEMDGGSSKDETGLENTKFSGTWDAKEETMTATGTVGQLYIGGFVRSGGKVYGFGVLQAKDGTKDYLILMR